MSSLLFFFYEITLLLCCCIAMLCWTGGNSYQVGWIKKRGESKNFSIRLPKNWLHSHPPMQLLLLLQRVCLQDKVPSLRCVGLREVGGRSSARSSRMRIMSIVLDCDCQYPPPAAHNVHLNLKLIASTISLYYCRVLLLPADQGAIHR